MAAAPSQAVFLSYASQDAAAARRIAEALRAAGVEVWFDQNELVGGDAWDAKIRKQIAECALFVPVISAATQARREGYFRLEWRLAVERMRQMDDNLTFLLPVVIDETKDAAAFVPDRFRDVQWTRLPGGETPVRFCERVKTLLTGKAAPASGRQSDGAGHLPAPPQRQSARSWTGPAFIGAALLVAVAAYSWLTRPTPEKSAAAKPAAPAPAPLAAPLLADAPGAKSVATDKSVAVLAFADLSEARNSEHFSDGVSEELLNVLAKVQDLRVAARTSAFFFKGKNAPIPEIAAKLGVAYVVEGSVQRAGERVKITAQLIKAADGFHVWSDTFTRDAKDVFAVQEEIAGRIAKELSLKLGVTTATATAAVNPQVFELYMQGRQAWNLRTPEGYARAEDLLTRALALEPNFARAHAVLALVWSVRNASSDAPRGDAIGAFGQRISPAVARIQAVIDRALALEPELAEAHTAQGHLFWNSWRIADATRSLRRAIELNPSDASAHQFLGRVLLTDGRMEEAAAALKRATELDPLSHRILDNCASALRELGRPADALALDERALVLQPDSIQAICWRALDLSALARHAEAVEQIRRLPADDRDYAHLAVRVFVAAGLREEAESALARAWRRNRHVALAELGRLEEALAAFDPASIGIPSIYELYNRSFDPVRTDPRFVKLLATLGLTEAHARAQAWRAAHPPERPAK